MMRDEPNMAWERFTALADSYGADLYRWPAVQRDAAEALLASDAARADGILGCAGRLDGLLDHYRTPLPSAALVGRILAAAPRPALLWSRAKLWWSGLGLAGVGLAGAVSGALALSLATPALLDHRAADWADGQTIFGDVDLDGTSR
ncbi:hypothetical protein KRZ98_16615 [Sphingobium sp. AS12]|uniref:hypothetical protein n=1 Tax=Sphingobium sp. AS12 TaxID=2849495 RepID=UPI001C316E89|nr:hypothetical protein [Sphingobium sp. AS12]MBV2149869.1 hypothetical protein [Sphingobium sp. AS12]